MLVLILCVRACRCLVTLVGRGGRLVKLVLTLLMFVCGRWYGLFGLFRGGRWCCGCVLLLSLMDLTCWVVGVVLRCVVSVRLVLWRSVENMRVCIGWICWLCVLLRLFVVLILLSLCLDIGWFLVGVCDLMLILWGLWVGCRRRRWFVVCGLRIMLT